MLHRRWHVGGGRRGSTSDCVVTRILSHWGSIHWSIVRHLHRWLPVAAVIVTVVGVWPIAWRGSTTGPMSKRRREIPLTWVLVEWRLQRMDRQRLAAREVTARRQRRGERRRLLRVHRRRRLMLMLLLLTSCCSSIGGTGSSHARL